MIEPLGEVGRIAACPPADVVGQEQLASPLNRSEAIAVAPLFAVEFPLTSLFLATDEIPYLVYLYLHSGEVLHFSRPKSFGVAADSLQEVQKGVAVDACNPLDGTNRVAFQQQPEAQNRLGLFQPHFSQGLGLLLDPRLATKDAAIPLVAVPILPVKLDGRVRTTGGYHGESAFRVGADSLELAC